MSTARRGGSRCSSRGEISAIVPRRRAVPCRHGTQCCAGRGPHADRQLDAAIADQSGPRGTGPRVARMELVPGGDRGPERAADGPPGLYLTHQRARARPRVRHQCLASRRKRRLHLERHRRRHRQHDVYEQRAAPREYHGPLRICSDRMGGSRQWVRLCRRGILGRLVGRDPQWLSRTDAGAHPRHARRNRWRARYSRRCRRNADRAGRGPRRRAIDRDLGRGAQRHCYGYLHAELFDCLPA